MYVYLYLQHTAVSKSQRTTSVGFCLQLELTIYGMRKLQYADTYNYPYFTAIALNIKSKLICLTSAIRQSVSNSSNALSTTVERADLQQV